MGIFDFRDRIPNTEEDGGSYEPPFKNGIRCPSCAQHLAFVVNNDDNHVTYVLSNEQYYRTDNDVRSEDITEFINNVKNAELSDYISINVPKDTIVSCPYCGIETKGIDIWKDAFNNPYKYIEYDDICDECGGEIFITCLRVQNKQIRICERCGAKK